MLASESVGYRKGSQSRVGASGKEVSRDSMRDYVTSKVELARFEELSLLNRA
jgi:hypothetical protein